MARCSSHGRRSSRRPSPAKPRRSFSAPSMLVTRRARGQSIGRLLTRGRLMTDDYQLTERAKAWIRGLRAHFGAAHAAHDLLPAAA